MDISIGLITGMSIGIELPPIPEEDISFALIIDLLIIRIMFIKWNGK